MSDPVLVELCAGYTRMQRNGCTVLRVVGWEGRGAWGNWRAPGAMP